MSCKPLQLDSNLKRSSVKTVLVLYGCQRPMEYSCGGPHLSRIKRYLRGRPLMIWGAEALLRWKKFLEATLREKKPHLEKKNLRELFAEGKKFLGSLFEEKKNWVSPLEKKISRKKKLSRRKVPPAPPPNH